MTPPDPDTQSTAIIPLTSIVSFYLAMIFAAVVWAGLTDPGLSLLHRAPVAQSVPWWVAGLLTGLSLVAVSVIAEPLMPSLRRLSAEIAGIIAPITRTRVIVFALTSGIAEELLFRGPVQYAIGYALASIVFALLHGGVSQKYIAWSTFALLAGLIFGLLAEIYRSVWPPALAHVVVNGINLARLARVAPATDDQDPQ